MTNCWKYTRLLNFKIVEDENREIDNNMEIIKNDIEQKIQDLNINRILLEFLCNPLYKDNVIC